MPDSNFTKAFITDNLTQFKDKVNTIGKEVGGLARLTTTLDSDLVGAINELDSDIGTRPHTTLTTTAKTLTGAINEIRAGGVALDNITADSSGKLGGFNDSAERSTVTNALNTLSADVKTLDSDIGSSRAKTTLTTTSKNIVGSINELDAELGDSAITVETGVTIKRALNALDSNHDSAISQLTTDIANSFRYTTISADTGSDTVDSASGSIAVVGDGIIQTSISGNRLLIDHTVVGATDVNNSGKTFVQDITMDSAGHVTAIGSTAVSGLVNADIAAGAGINAEKIHDGTVSNTEFGHLNGVTSGIQSQIDGITTANNNTITLTAGTGISGGGDFTLNQNADSSFTFNIDANQSGNITQFGQSSQNNVISTSSYFQINFSGTEEFRFMSNGNFHADGDIIAFSNTTASDRRLKQDIKKIPGALKKISQLRGVEYNWNGDVRYGKNQKSPTRSQMGLIAQEVEKVLPNLVQSNFVMHGKRNDNIVDSDGNIVEETYKTVDYIQLIGLLVEGIKELQKEATEIKTSKK